MGVVVDTVEGKKTYPTVQDCIRKQTENTKTYKPDLDFRLKLEISGADVVIQDDYARLDRGLDIDFDIVKSYEDKPQTSKIKIYNLSVATYNLIYEKGEVFRLSCARGENDEFLPFYSGEGVSAVRQGGKTVLTKNQGFMAQDANAGRKGQNDLVTEITLKNSAFAQLYKSYQSDVSTEIIIDDCRQALGYPKGHIDSNIKHVTKRAGYTIKGDVSKALNSLAVELGFTWNCNDMSFNMYDALCSNIQTYGIVLNPENSNTPERLDDSFKSTSKVLQRAKKKDGTPQIKQYNITRIKRGFKIETMLLPFLEVGSTVRLDFPLADAQGDKYVYKVHHTGSNTGTNCITEVYCA